MAIRPRGNTWQVDLTVRGRRLPRYAFPTKQEAEKWEATAKAAALNGDPIPCPNGPTSGNVDDGKRSRKGEAKAGTLGDILSQTYARYWANSRSAKTCEKNMAQVEAHFGADHAIDRIDVEAIDGFIDACIAKGNSNGTINRKLAVLSKALRFAFDRKLLTHLPKIERKEELGGRFRWLTEQEERALLQLLTQWGKTDHVEVITVLIDTGMRPSEVYRMAPRDVDLKAGTISIWVTKTNKPRTVYMTKRVKEIIERRVGAVTALGDALFPYDNVWMRHTWDRAKTHLKLAHDPHFVPYICRHTCASRLVQRGVPINVVKEWLGHTTVQMTMRYAFLAPTNLQQAAQALEAAE